MATRFEEKAPPRLVFTRDMTSQNLIVHNTGYQDKAHSSEAWITRGSLPFVRINRLGRALNNGKGFFKISRPTERNGAYHLHFDFPVIVFGWWETGNWKVSQMVRKFLPFRSERKRGVPLKVLHNFRTEFPENYLTNGKHPWSLHLRTAQCRVTKG